MKKGCDPRHCSIFSSYLTTLHISQCLMVESKLFDKYFAYITISYDLRERNELKFSLHNGPEGSFSVNIMIENVQNWSEMA